MGKEGVEGGVGSRAREGVRYAPGVVAAAFRAFDVGPRPGTARAHWMTYLADSWSLAIHGHAMVGERPLARHDGPRYETLEAELDAIEATGEGRWTLDAGAAEIVEHVRRRYADLGVEELLHAATRHGDPWFEAWVGGLGEIPAKAARRHFVALATAGRRIREDEAAIASGEAMAPAEAVARAMTGALALTLVRDGLGGVVAIEPEAGPTRIVDARRLRARLDAGAAAAIEATLAIAARADEGGAEAGASADAMGTTVATPMVAALALATWAQAMGRGEASLVEAARERLAARRRVA